MSKHNNHHQESAGEVKGNSQGNAKSEQGSAGEEREKAQEKPMGSVEKSEEGHSPEAAEEKSAGIETELEKQALKIADLEAKLAELNDQYLRKAADFENYRKRMVREKQEITDFANQSLLLDLLPVIDDFERAIKSAETSDLKSAKDFASFYEGIVMIEKGLSTMLENKWGLKRFDSAGEPFDPNRHEAIQMEKAAGITEAVVKEDYLKGYFLKERVLRCAKVKVLMPADNAAGGGQPAAAGEPPSPGLDREK